MYDAFGSSAKLEKASCIQKLPKGISRGFSVSTMMDGWFQAKDWELQSYNQQYNSP